ncbi:MAG TPA: SusC/RagA family TonB-linked outer membrane protein [Paludibacter sp.]|jgi:TonB-linked SusC/RagA family outer membrane protein|nr:SusC/RagA family TonB-linked outer membrane protein [Paludibacter sp.]HOS45800.1 SusC/RagA family TonB-linked outer membrane protein [Paludibacter sp.]
MFKYYILTFFIFISVGLWAQPISVTGVVVDDAGEEVIGATVVVKGNEQHGTITDIDGKFSLQVPDLQVTLVFSYVGMKSVELKATSQMRVVLSSDAKELEEVVVTGILKMDKRLFTGATDKLDAEKTKIDGITDISRALEGRSAGVSVQNVSGTFGTAPKIRVRGATSIYGNSKPLWVVDGVIMEDAVDVSSDELSSGNAETLISSAIAGINADDIESFQILKDGSATSIYGARAMAGVVVITTKKGKAGVNRINYTGEFTSRLVPSYSDFNISNSQQQMGIYQEMERKGWLEFASVAAASNSGVYGKMYQLINQYENGQYGLENSEAAKNAYLREAEFRNTDWFKLLFNNSLTQNHAVSISSGTDKANFYASLSVFDDPGWTKASDVQRYTANVNALYKISDKLSISLLTNGAYRSQKAPGTLSQDVDVVRGEVKRDFDINPYSFALNSSRTLDPNEFYTRNYAPFNIFHELENNYIDLSVTDLKFQSELNWKVIRGLEANVLAAIKYQTSSQEHHIKDHSNQAEAYRAGVFPEDATIAERNPLLYTDPDNPNALPVSILPEGGIYNRTAYGMKGVDFRTSLNYNGTIADTHIINLFGGMETGLVDRQRTWFRGWGYQYDNGGIPFYDPNVFKQGKEENADYYTNIATYTRDVAFFASATYSYLGRYTLNGTGRYEGSNKLGRSRAARWLPTWNVAAAWNAHEEEWFGEYLGSVLSFGALKASYSLTADRGPAFVTNSLAVFKSYTPWRPTAGVSESGIYIEDLENSELTYEKKHELNVGASLGFLKNRINLETDFYVRRNFDLIGLIYTQGAGGQIAKYANVASMQSHGVELTISTRNIENQHFKWNTDFIFSDAVNRITDLDSRSNVIQLISGSGYAKKGYPVRSLFSIPFAGLNDEGLPTFINEDGEQTLTDLNFQEFEKLGFLKYEGPTDPTITGSLGNNFSWKGLKLNIFITYSFGNKVRLNPVFSARYSDLSAMPKEFKNRWTLPGDETFTNIPVIASMRQNRKYADLSYAYNAYNYSDIRVADGGFIRLKEISLAYDLPKSWISLLSVQNAQVKLQATNLLLLYADRKLNGQDPEFFNSGGVATPMPKQLTFTLRFGL